MGNETENTQNMLETISQLVDLSDTSVYVSDYETDELLYINETGKKVLGVSGTCFEHQTCHDFLMHRGTHCPFCHKSTLKSESFVQNVIQFPFNGRHYSIRSKIINWNGRKAHVHYISDVEDQIRIQQRIEQEQIIQENRFQRIIESMENADADDLIAKGRYDLYEDKILFYQRKSENSLHLMEGITFTYALNQMLETAANKNSSELLKTKLNREHLIHEYGKGTKGGNIEYQRCGDDGATFWSLLRFTLHRDPENGHIIFFVYTYDITERVLENHMLKKLGSTEYDVLGLIDIKTHQFESKSVKGVKSLADSGNKYFRGKFESIIHQQIVATVLEGEQQELEKRLQLNYIEEKLIEQEAYEVAFFAFKSDRSYRRKKMRFCYLDDSKTMIFYICTDITELYNREQRQLRRTEDALEAARTANASKTEFFSRMSHDMRTPMNGILGLAELSEDETDPVVLKDYIEKIKSSGQYLLGLINDTLDFQRIESGKLQLEPQIVNCNDIIHNVIDMLQPSIEKKHLIFTVNNKNVITDCYMRIDPVRIKQIFLNLFSNAVKFTPEGGMITADFECLKRDGMIAHDRFVIRDSGIGMSEDFLKNRIFKPFSQESNEVSGLYAGSGLGLSIVRSLVHLMGGTIEVESELGVGTAFTVCLDFEKVNEQEAAQMENSVIQKKADMSEDLKNKQILLAEDHPLNAEITQKLLEKAGCIVTWAKNGKECIKCYEDAEESFYDVILMDVRMPVMDGIAATKQIRQSKHKDAQTIPIIAMTANAYEEDVHNCLEAGMNNHLAKPINTTKMYETLYLYLQK